MILTFSSRAAQEQQTLVCFVLLPLCFGGRSGAVGARVSALQQVQCVNSEKNITHVVCVSKPGKYYESNKISLLQAA